MKIPVHFPAVLPLPWRYRRARFLDKLAAQVMALHVGPSEERRNHPADIA
jgi:hypothetical protein